MTASEHGISRRMTALLLIIALLCSFCYLAPQAYAQEEEAYLTYEEAIATIVSIMERREYHARDNRFFSVSFTYDYPEKLTTAQIQDLILAGIEAHTGVPTQGDSLRVSYASWCLEDITDRFDGTTHYITVGRVNFWYYSPSYWETQVEKRIDEILASLQLEEKSHVEKIYAIYDYICQNVAYDHDHIALLESGLIWDPNIESFFTVNCPYGALFTGKTCCTGFASVLYRMLLEAGIDNRIITGEQHAWNIVLVDGAYYFLDATWDTGMKEYMFFLKGSASFFDVDHIAEERFWQPEFLEEYPISILDYGQEPLTGDVLGNGSCGSKATWKLTGDGVLTVQGSGTVTADPAWSKLRGYVTKLVIGSGITAIDSNAFEGFPLLLQVELPDTLISIGSNAFLHCTGLETVELPDSVTQLGSGAFRYCRGLKTVRLPQGLTQIPKHAFYGCSSLTGITIPASVTTIGEGAFCRAFAMDGSAAVTVPATVTDLAGLAFYESHIGSVEFLAQMDTLPAYTFCFCDDLKTAVVGDQVTHLGEQAFAACTQLENLILPANLADCGSSVFLDCQSLQQIQLPDTMTAVPDRMFMGCESLNQVEIPTTVTKICRQAFAFCKALETVRIPESVTTLEDYIFAGCQQMERVVIPAGVTRVTALALSEMPGLKDVLFQGDAPTFQTSASDGMRFWDNIYFSIFYPEGNSSWEKYAKDIEYEHVPWHTGTEHTASEQWRSVSKEEHVQYCTVCDNTLIQEHHTFDEGKRDEKVMIYTCTKCGKTKKERAPEGTPTAGSANDLTTVYLIAGIAAAAAIGSVGAVLALKRKKK